MNPRRLAFFYSLLENADEALALAGALPTSTEPAIAIAELVVAVTLIKESVRRLLDSETEGPSEQARALLAVARAEAEAGRGKLTQDDVALLEAELWGRSHG